MSEKDAEIARLRQWVNDLHSGMYINCVYCGHRYGPQDEVPSSMADVLKEHVEQCPEHPMSALKKQLRELQEELGACAMQINCAGPVSHRIKILKMELSGLVDEKNEEIAGLKKRVAELEEKLNASKGTDAGGERGTESPKGGERSNSSEHEHVVIHPTVLKPGESDGTTL